MIHEIEYVGQEGGVPLLLLSKEERAEIELAVAADEPLAGEFQAWAESEPPKGRKKPEPPEGAHEAWWRNEQRRNELLTDDLLRSEGFETARFEVRENGLSDKRGVFALRRKRLAGVEDFEEWDPAERILFMGEVCLEYFAPRLLSGWPQGQPLPASFTDRLAKACYALVFPDFAEDRRRFLARSRPGSPQGSPSS